MADDVGLLLNLDTGGDVGAGDNQSHRLNRKSWSVKKQFHQQRKAGFQGGRRPGGGRGGGRHAGGRGGGSGTGNVGSDGAAPAPASGSSALKGYDLAELPVNPRDGTRNASSSGGAPAAHASAAAGTAAVAATAAASASGALRAGTQENRQQQHQHNSVSELGRPGQRYEQAGKQGQQQAGKQQRQQQQRGNQKREQQQPRLRQSNREYRESTPDSDAMVAASDDEAVEVASAVAAFMARDADLERDLQQHAPRHKAAHPKGNGAGGYDSDSGGDSDGGAGNGALGVVSFRSTEAGGQQGGGKGVDGGAKGSRSWRDKKRERGRDRRAAAEADDDGPGGGGDQKQSKKPKPARQPGMQLPSPGTLVHHGKVSATEASRDVFGNGSGGDEGGGSGGAGNDPARGVTGEAGAGGGGGGGDGGGGGGDGFESLGLSKGLADHLEECNFSTPTRIQRQVIPALLAGRDVLASAPTGSGKTLAFLAPIVHSLASVSPRISRGDGTHALVVAPTRELALQIHATLALLLRAYHWLVGGMVIGGENRNHEKQRLRKGVTVLVATPGRLLDHLANTSSFRCHELRWLVLDEADRLLDLGFEKKLAEVVQHLDKSVSEAGNERWQTALLSATLHPQLGALAGLSLVNPAAIGFKVTLPHPSSGGGGSGGQLRIEPAIPGQEQKPDRQQQLGEEFFVGNVAKEDGWAHQQEQFTIPRQLKQLYLEVPCKLRLVALAAVLKGRCSPLGGGAGGGAAKVVVFMSACDCVEFAHRVLGELVGALFEEPLLECPLFKLHGLLTQAERTDAFVAFTRCRSGVLLCTDVAARGLDFPAVTTIVQYDPPGEASEYVHRVGRTARMGRKGDALLMLQPHEAKGYLSHLEAAGVSGLREEALTPLLDWLLPSNFMGQARKGRTLESHEGAYQLQRALMQAVEQDPDLTQLAADAFRSFVRSYTAHPAAVRDVFHIKRLHLGHVAHAFALKQMPSMIGISASKQAMKRKKDAAATGGNRNKQSSKKLHVLSE